MRRPRWRLEMHHWMFDGVFKWLPTEQGSSWASSFSYSRMVEKGSCIQNRIFFASKIFGSRWWRHDVIKEVCPLASSSCLTLPEFAAEHQQSKSTNSQTLCVADTIVADTVFETIFLYRYRYPLLLSAKYRYRYPLLFILYRPKYSLPFWWSHYRYFFATFGDFKPEFSGY